MRRRALLLAAFADAEFPASIEAGGRRLVLNGTGRRLYSWLRIEVYRAALYLERPSGEAEAILAAAGPRLVEVHYRRAVPLESVVAAWEASLGETLPGAFRAWLRPVAVGDVERQLFLADGVVLEGLGRPAARVGGAGFARRLLDCWIGQAMPDEALRRGLLGLGG
jgi:hypothetical protein